MSVLDIGTYRTVRGELLHRRVDTAGHVRCEIEQLDGSLCEVDEDGAVAIALLSHDPGWPCDRDDPVGTLVDAD